MTERQEETDSGSGSTPFVLLACALLYFKEVPQKFVSGLNTLIYGTSASSKGKGPVAPAPASGVKHAGPPARVKNQPQQEKNESAESQTAAEYASAKAEVERLGGYVGVDWALGEVKNQKSEGACTAFAISSALEAMLYSRFQIRATINAPTFWSSYGKPSLISAFASTLDKESKLVAEVDEASRFHPFAKGARLRIQIPLDSVARLTMDQVPEALQNRYPVLLSTVYGAQGHTALRRGSLISAHRTKQNVAHVTLLSSMSTNTTYRGMLWLRFRNSWGAEWGDNGNASLDARHCLMNACEFMAIREIRITELEQPEATTGANGT